MRKFFISTHGSMASGIKSSLEILMGPQNNVVVFDAYLNDKKIEDAVENFLEDFSEDNQYILLSDLYGGSVNQVLYQYLGKENIFLITGINLALVIELVSQSEMPINSIEIDNIIDEAKNTIKQCKLDNEKVVDEDFF